RRYCVPPRCRALSTAPGAHYRSRGLQLRMKSMLQTEIQSKLAGVIRNFFELPDLAVDESTTAAQVDGWDSIAHVGLIVAVERAFGVRFTTKEVKALRTVGDLSGLLEKRTT